MLGRIVYRAVNDGALGYSYGNICRDLSIVNGKNYEHTTRDGHVKGYIVNYTVVGSDSQFLTVNSGGAATGGEWTYSKMSSTPLYTLGASQMKDSVLRVADEYPLLICGANVAGTQESGTSGQYAAVAMINSYNLDRMDVITPTTEGETIQGPVNPLAALRSSGNQAAGEILEITNDLEKEKPPYDLSDDGDSTKTQITEFIKTPTTLGVVRGTMFIPAGVFEIQQSLDSGVLLALDVVAEVLCKDMA